MSSLSVRSASADASERTAVRAPPAAALSAVKGMNDLLPDDMAVWEQVESSVAYVFRQ